MRMMLKIEVEEIKTTIYYVTDERQQSQVCQYVQRAGTGCSDSVTQH